MKVKFTMPKSSALKAQFNINESNTIATKAELNAEIEARIEGDNNLQSEIQRVENEIPDISGLASKEELERVESEIPDVSNLATKTELQTVENKIPTVNDGTLTIIQDNEIKGVFSANSSNNIVVNLEASGGGAVESVNSKIGVVVLTANDVGALSSSTTINDLTTTAQQNALNSGATTANIGQIATNANDISLINDKIPAQASTSNQLADKDFVNSSIATNTANFIGTFNSVAELEVYTGTLTNNDYAFVATTDAAGNTLYDRYKWNGTEWLFEYELNNSSFTAVQWAAINSGATSTNIGQIATNASDIADLQTNKQDVLTAGANVQINGNVISATDTIYTAGTGISIINGVISNTQTSAEWGNIQGTLSNQTDLQNALDSKLNTSDIIAYTANEVETLWESI